MSGYKLNEQYYDRLNGALLNYKEGDVLVEIDPYGFAKLIANKRLEQKIEDSLKIIAACNALISN